MPGQVLGTVNVEYSYRDGYHIFTSPDLKGLYVADKDAAQAGRDVQKAIELLVKLNEDIACEVVVPASFHEFLDIVKRDMAFEAGPSTLASRTYILRCG